MFSWRHLETSSDLLFRSVDFSALIMKNFSAKHKVASVRFIAVGGGGGWDRPFDFEVSFIVLEMPDKF